MVNYKKFIRLILLFLTFLFTTHAYSGAAEKWSYDVTPDQNQKLDVKGHKVDGYGNAANDYEYNRKIDPKTAANRTKMGTVGMGRLLKSTGWGLLGAAALQGLLEAVDWVIDPAAQSIWRYKKTGQIGFGCKNFGYKWKIGAAVYNCPVDAFDQFNICKTNTTAKNCTVKELWADESHTIKVATLPDTAAPPFIDIEVGYNYNTVQDKNYIRVYKGEKIQEEPKEKEQITPEQIADYANHTHPDYSDPNLLPKLAPKYNPQIAPDLWKPANPWEYDNSPTVDEVKKELEQAKPEPKDDTIKENQPDPETGGKSFSLPAFCSWATAVCELADFIKEKYKSAEENLTEFFRNEDVDTELEFNDPTNVTNTSVSFSSQCPAPITLAQFSYHGISQNWKVDFSDWCHVLSTFLKPIVIAMASFSAVLIVSGVRENG